MKDTRKRRYDLFARFQESAKDRFEELRATAKKRPNYEEDIVNLYRFNVCGKGRLGGIDHRLVEVFYGNRAYDYETAIIHSGADNKRLLTEKGAELAFSLNDSGYVTIFLYPAKAEYSGCREDSILLKKHVHPKKLFKTSFLSQLWVRFNAYMERTCLEGRPSWKDRSRVWYLRTFKPLIIDKQIQRTRFCTFCNSVAKFVFQVGLSGFIIFLLTVFPNRKQNDISQERIVSQIDSITLILNEIAIQNKITVSSHDTVLLDLNQ